MFNLLNIRTDSRVYHTQMIASTSILESLSLYSVINYNFIWMPEIVQLVSQEGQEASHTQNFQSKCIGFKYAGAATGN